MHSILATDRKAAIGLAAVALAPTLRATAEQVLAGTVEWSVF